MSQVWAAQRVPEERHTVDILPTFVISVEEFYAYVPCACDCVAKKNPKELKALINTPEKRQKYVQIQKRPGMTKSLLNLSTATKMIFFCRYSRSSLRETMARSILQSSSD